MHGGRHVGELDKIAEILERRVAAPGLDVMNERRSITGCKNTGRPANLEVAGGIPRVLGETARRLGTYNFPAKAPGKADPLAVDLRPRSREPIQRAGKAPKVDPHLFEDGLGVGLDLREPVLGEDLKRRHGPSQVGEHRCTRLGARRLAGRAPPSASALSRSLHRKVLLTP